MNFLSNVLDSIPVVGHVKGVVHYAVGDTDGGHKAMYQSTRTSAVLAGGAVGCLAGPAGAVAGAMYAGIATDTVASIASDKPQGIIEGIDNISHDIKTGQNPTKSILSTGMQLGLDGVGGLGMGGVSSAVGNISEKAVTKTVESIGKQGMAKIVTKQVSEKAVQKAIGNAVIQAEIVCVTGHIGINASKRTEKEMKEKREEERAKERKDRYEREERERKQREQKEKEKKASAGSQQGSNQGSGSGSGPPQGNQNNKKNNKNFKNFDIFMKVLKRLLKQIYGNENEPISEMFERLSDGQIAYLDDIIRVTINTGTLEEVVELVLRIFREHMPKHISFENFLSLIEFVRAYLLREIDTRQTESTRYTQGTRDQRRAQILRDIMRERHLVEALVRLFKRLQSEIETENAPPKKISPDFRDIFAAVYHYFKHRCVPEDGILTVKEYYDWIRKIQAQLKKKARYRNEVENQRGPVTCRYEVYVDLFGRRFRIVVKVREGDMVLSSAFFVEISYEGDAEGDEDLKIYKKKS